MKDISAFVAVKARAANNPVFGSVMDVTPDSKRGGTKPRSSSKSSDPSFSRITTLNTQGTMSSKQGNQPRCSSGNVYLSAKIRVCPAYNGNHVLMECQNFERKTFDERVQIMRKAQLCHNCFQYGHIARGCLTKVHVKLMVVSEGITPCSILPISKDRTVTNPVKTVSIRSPRYHRLPKILELLKPLISRLSKVDNRTVH